MACKSSINVIGEDGTSQTVNSPVCIPDGPKGAGVITIVVSLLLIFAALASLFMLLWGGVQYITSGGNPEQVAKARGRIMYAVIGLTLAFLSLVIFKVLGGIIGFQLLF